MPEISGEYDPYAGLPQGGKILLAFSGGIDSSVAAKLCMDAGFQILPVHLCMIPGSEDPAHKDRVNKVSHALGLGDVHFLSLQNEFRKYVMAPCWREFSQGRTPNPCALCNPVFKFGKLMDYAKNQNCCAAATGHYAKIIHTAAGTMLYRGTDTAKDQSYFLFGLSERQLGYACFPLGGMLKSQVRELAKKWDLPNASDPESQDICFANGDVQLAEYLRQVFQAEAVPGNFVDQSGKVLGHHNGFHTFTPGQRKGTGVAMGKPAFVKFVNAANGEIVMTTENADLMADTLYVRNIPRLSLPEGTKEFSAMVQIRYRGKPSPAVITMTGIDSAAVHFENPQRAITPGQAAVFYDNCRQIGGGWISLIP